MDIQIRKAAVEDVSMAVPLLAATMGNYGVMTLGLGDPERQRKVLHSWFQAKGNRFSFEKCWLAVVDGKVVGLLLTFGGKELPALEKALSRGIFKLYSLFELLRLLWRMLFLGYTREAFPDEYVLAHLAVDGEFRRQGIALLLLEKAESMAKEREYRKISLEVEIDNNPAETLYNKVGYHKVFTTEFSSFARGLNCPGFHHLVKEL